MTRKITRGTTFSKVLGLARGTTLAPGAAVTPALLLGVGTTVLAAVPGDPFRASAPLGRAGAPSQPR